MASILPISEPCPPEKNCTVLIVENRNTCDDNSPKVKLTKEQKKVVETLYRDLN